MDRRKIVLEAQWVD
jgi:hypothetical protein